MKGALAFLDGHTKLLLHDVESAVVRHLQVIDASHDTWQVVVRAVRGLAGLADDSEHGRERFETCVWVSIVG